MYSTHRQSSIRSSNSQANQPVVCIVDPQMTDYTSWQAIAVAAGVRLEFLTRGTDALRKARGGDVALWVVNTQLPDLHGADLCVMLKNRRPRAAVYLVADEYSVEQEREAGAARATLFGCKGSHHKWLAEWLTHRTAGAASAAVHA